MANTKQVEIIARHTLRQFLLANLPAKVASLNAGRAAVLTTTTPGPWTMPANAVLNLSVTNRGNEQPISLVAGTLSAAALQAAINAVFPGAAVTDTLGRVSVTSANAPSGTTIATVAPSVVSVGADGDTGVNLAFGWDPGGEYVVSTPLIAPTNKGVMDGWPAEWGDVGQGFWIIMDDTHAVPTQNIRQDEYLVSIQMHILREELQKAVTRNREPIMACLRAVRECIINDRTLGTGGAPCVIALEKESTVAGRLFQWKDGPLLDVATTTWQMRLFERYP